MSALIWHYTLRYAAKSILKEGVIYAGKRPFEPRPLIWFSAAESYDPSASGSAQWRRSREESTTFESLGGAFRFGVPQAAVLHWRAGRRLTGIQPNTFVDRQTTFGADPSLWYVNVGNMRLHRVVAVEVCFDEDGKDWSSDEKLSGLLEEWHETYRREREKRAQV